MSNYHKPVLLEESVSGLVVNPAGVYVDVTFGGGGHSQEILKRLNSEGRLIAFDQDKDVLSNVFEDERFMLVQSNFRYLKNYLRYLKVGEVDGVLADFGVSSHQFDEQKRGFSFRFDAELDMRMNTSQEKNAKTVLNEYDEKRLGEILWWYGEVKSARKIAAEIVKSRSEKPLETTFDLVGVVKKVLKREDKKVLAQVFQAVRIEVNDELQVIERLLEQLPDVVKSGGRVAFITYHSLEDRLVKNFIKTGTVRGRVEKDVFGKIVRPFEEVSKKPIVPSEKEIKENPRARSAKLRIAQKI
ncbi:MAG TPA: 16S rRNA (cytosine(1402)-N(4))-methyltransferase [Flavobacteriales bacterium]|nr:16S rRNA (cytosine(1402)-N(4))-methyltransferase [Flavobacteriales bacterium]|tara:strand:- start:63951 stop:64850 length:900 start_codon:yes stop_codon:yes gene_type:complete